MTSSSATEAIATLINLAQQGEIDPWDVQVIDVIDRFLNELGITQYSDNIYQQATLPKSGQAFLWASMLVRFKADTLEQLGNNDPQTEELIELEEITDETRRHFRGFDLEKHLRRRSAAPPTRQRRVTLQELITQIEEIAEELEKSTPSPRRRQTPRLQSQREAMAIVTQLAHQENLTELAAQLDQFFQEQLLELTNSQSQFELEELLNRWHQVQPPHDGESKQDRVGIFWALLLLSSQSKVELSQSEFYQDLKIQVLSAIE
ncbi:segregation/condensation protein A [Crocosphaera sp. XPORK-15E]|uniref:segregation/condensation protein A n=1 Tax=Crocosphaera sp. XPORK-15E TaxID=3110247 RepID=UPI002B21EB93|nr:segregation/condensation protein A [Crocosphaera sp. XPORK-15E]MEA5534768.1 segregation/condensation protein A [Crocosphaera sp. XPORK-15E]